MRHNWLEGTSATGGTGDLALIAGANGFPPPYLPWTGIRQVRYDILEYNSNPSATNATLLRAESGYCPLDTSGPTLKRSDATIVLFSSWDGTTLYPKMGSATAASKQSFSTNSGNIRIICSAGAEDNPFMSPTVAATIGAATNYGHSPFYASSSATQLSFTTGVVFYWPFSWLDFGLYSKISLYLGNPSSSSTGSVYAAIYEVSKTGVPGKQLANFGALSITPVFGGAVITSSALATPVFLDPSLYWLALLPVFTGGSPYCDALPSLGGGPLGATSTGLPVLNGTNVQTGSGQSAPLPDPATAPTVSGTATTVPWFGLQ